MALDDLPHLQRWAKAIGTHPAAQKGTPMPPSRTERAGDEKTQQFAAQERKMLEMGRSRESGV